MYDFVLSFIIGGSDSEGWENILFLVVVAVIWGVGGIIKSRAEQAQRKKQVDVSRRQAQTRQAASGNKTEIKKSDELLEKALRFKEAVAARQIRRAESRQTQVKRPVPKKISQTRPIEQKPKHVPVPPVPKQKKSVEFDELAKIDPKIQDLPDFIPDAINKSQSKKPIKKTYKDLQIEFPLESLFAYGDSDELKRAILYSEILGKPLSIRESTGFYN